MDEDESPTSNYVELLHPSASHPQSSVLVTWILIFVQFLCFKYGISDAITSLLLKFFKTLFVVLGAFSEICKDIGSSLPGTLHLLRSGRTLLKNHIVCYVVCPKCFHVYLQSQCTTESSAHQPQGKLCPYKRFPTHRYAHMRQACGSKLLKTVELSSGKRILYPYLSYCYLSLKQSLQNLLQRPQFIVGCEKWCLNISTMDDMTDVYDGKIWRDFQQFNDKPFLSEPLAFGLMMNVDWFQPFDHNTYSVGAIYMTVMNLPRDMRYKRENVILGGLIPGPKEPSDNNPFFKPLVEELLELWEGVQMAVDGHDKTVRCAVLCIACDIPAGRKICGLPWYTAHYACSRCKKYFPGTFGCIDYSGFNRDSWPPRTISEHRRVATQIRRAGTLAEIEHIESNSGYHYSALLNLPYLDISRMLIVDPMHNLFLGTSKRVIKKIWIGRQIISESDLDNIQSSITESVVPPDIGCIPLKIKSGFADLTADELKNWVIYFSIFSMKDILSHEQMECWRLFVHACRILCQKRLSFSEIKQADTLLLIFCQQIESVYDKTEITPNMHMHAHLCECILDYGPLHGFWLFSFKRYNGVLGRIATNNCSVEHQFMQRFLEDNDFLSISNPAEFSEEFSAMFSYHPSAGSVSETVNPSTSDEFTSYQDRSCIVLPNHYTKALFSIREVEELKQLYSRIYSVPLSSIELHQAFKKYKNVSVYNKQIGSFHSRSKNTSTVMISWNKDLFCGGMVNEDRPARVNYFAEHNITVNGNNISHILVSVSWFKHRPDRYYFGQPVTVWECDIFELFGCHSTIPIQLIKGRTVSCVYKLNEESVLVIVPCVDF